MQGLNEGQVLLQWFSNLSVHRNHLEALLKHCWASPQNLFQ